MQQPISGPSVPDQHVDGCAQATDHAECKLDRMLGADSVLVLAHELRSPLAAIASAIELLDHESPSPQRVNECVALMRRQMSIVREVLSDLAVRSADSASRRLETTMDVRRCVDAAIECCQPLLRERHHELSVAMPQQPVWWTGERSHLLRSIVNLLDNAAHYTSVGGHIVVALQADRGRFALSVTDDGIGLSGEALVTIFAPHVRGIASATAHPEGHGIGLALVDEIARTYGGRVQASSAGPGLGSTFTLLLPTPVVEGSGPESSR